MEQELGEMITHYGLEEDPEHVIIPLRDKGGKKKRFFLLKRRFLRIVYPDGHFVDFPIGEVIEAVVRYPDIRLSQALELLHRELDLHISEIFGDKKETRESTHEEDID